MGKIISSECVDWSTNNATKREINFPIMNNNVIGDYDKAIIVHDIISSLSGYTIHDVDLILSDVKEIITKQIPITLQYPQVLQVDNNPEIQVKMAQEQFNNEYFGGGT